MEGQPSRKVGIKNYLDPLSHKFLESRRFIEQVRQSARLTHRQAESARRQAQESRQFLYTVVTKLNLK